MEEKKETAVMRVEQNYCREIALCFDAYTVLIQFHQSSIATDHAINNHSLNGIQISVPDMSVRFQLLTKHAAYFY